MISGGCELWSWRRVYDAILFKEALLGDAMRRDAPRCDAMRRDATFSIRIQVEQSVKYKPYVYMKSTRQAADARVSSFVAVNQTPFARGDHFLYELR